MSRKLIFTIDVDRDVNFAIPGVSGAGSIDRGAGIAPRFTSSERGLKLLCELLDEVGVIGTFFIEGRTAEIIDCSPVSDSCIGLHGYDHEDLTGETTGLTYTREDVQGILDRGFAAVESNVGRPRCFRAPYMTATNDILSIVQSMGIGCDSSSYYRMSDVGVVDEPIPGMVRYPVPKTKDMNGKTMAAYLWPMHEGRRRPSDYVWMASTVRDGPLVLATHSWHIVESREDGMMSEDRVEENLNNVRKILEGILDQGFTSVPMQ